MAEPLPQKIRSQANSDFSVRTVTFLAALALLAILVMGYHPGLEDDSFYLAAVKKNLNPALFPYDSEFFRLQFQATIFDKVVSNSVRLTHLPLPWASLLWQFAAIFFLLHGCWRISRRCFHYPEGQWGSVTLIACLLSLPLPGVAILISDQYLHPRALATALILAAIVAVIDRKLWLAAVWLTIAVTVHAMMACFGISLCAFLLWNLRRSRGLHSQPVPVTAFILLPLGWMFEPASDAWRHAAATRGFYFLGRWRWYEWLGVFAPLLILVVVRSLLRQR